MIGHVSKLTVVAYIINASYGGFPIRMKLLKLCSAHCVILPSEIFFDPPPAWQITSLIVIIIFI